MIGNSERIKALDEIEDLIKEANDDQLSFIYNDTYNSILKLIGVFEKIKKEKFSRGLHENHDGFSNENVNFCSSESFYYIKNIAVGKIEKIIDDINRIENPIINMEIQNINSEEKHKMKILITKERVSNLSKLFSDFYIYLDNETKDSQIN